MAKAKFGPTYARLLALLIEGREKAELKQSDLALKLGKPQSYISKIESGERRLDVAEFIELVTAMGSDPVQILKKTIAKA